MKHFRSVPVYLNYFLCPLSMMLIAFAYFLLLFESSLKGKETTFLVVFCLSFFLGIKPPFLLFPQDLTNLNMYEASLALDALANFVTPELARDLANDVITLMTSVRVYYTSF